MPWKHEWVQPDLAFTVTKFKPTTKTERASLWIYQVFHAYKNDDYNERLSYWYTLHDGDPANHPPAMSDVDHTYFEFDIRDFPTYDHSMDYDKHGHQVIMQQALDADLCTIEDVFLHIEKAQRGTNATQ
tara:strand:+ start:3434 stop:3820 length:387 start_codon:yes stop_codon:yes gene_type:complete